MHVFFISENSYFNAYLKLVEFSEREPQAEAI
jgi:hypothetical protein